ncbi:MAG: pyrroline-5-carboxylate reductase [Elusimicrobia bacterium HGW-Elusimicrobia-1]|jgi:pyrroline-5-carboxylate reductase|nr:MAG: pyrroline-5-carboxylate reductase [Elusimicrobia bacterium HGW-Elusimicrobia-1]
MKKNKITARGKIVFIGAGKMAEALMSAVISAGISPTRIVAADVSAVRRAAVKRKFGVSVERDNSKAVAGSAVTFLCVKPQQLSAALDEISTAVSASGTLVVSIAAGVDLRSIERKIPAARVIRAMPNTPVAVGEGVVCFARGRRATAKDAALLKSLLGGSARMAELPENMINAVTAVTGSGPAYFYYFAEALESAARTIGFDAKTASALVEATASGAAAMMVRANKSPSELRADVTSAGGTTAAAVKVFDRARLPQIIRGAVDAARRRAEELSGSARNSLNGK